MLNKRTGLIALLFVIIALGVFVNLKPAKFPQGAKHTLDEFIQRFEGPGFGYTIVSAERGMANYNDSPSYRNLGVRMKEPGICPDFDPELEENWCVVLDRAVETSSGAAFTHFIVQKQGQLWVVDGVPDSGTEVFQQLGCKWY